MKRLIGIALFILGALPLVLVMARWVMWMDHAYTLGLSLNAERVLAALLMADIVCFVCGALLDRSQIKLTNKLEYGQYPRALVRSPLAT
jgi:hypothetical protein